MKEYRIGITIEQKRQYSSAFYGLLMAIGIAAVCTCLILSSTAAQIEAPIIYCDHIQQPEPERTIKPDEYTSSQETIDPSIYYMAQVPAADVNDIERIARTLWGECRGVNSTTRQAAVVWCIFNRIDDPRWPNNIAEVCIHSQFNGYKPDNPIDTQLFDLALDVYTRYYREKAGDPDAGRVLPKEYVYFSGDGKENNFRDQYKENYTVWDWSLPSPYET